VGKRKEQIVKEKLNGPEYSERRGVPRKTIGKNKGGRPPKLKNQIERAMKTLDAALPDLISRLIDLAYTKNDRDALIYLIDRKMGRPAASINANIKGAIITVSPDDYATAIATARAAEMALLTMPALLDTPTLQEEYQTIRDE
jgi:hypothetical protein